MDLATMTLGEISARINQEVSGARNAMQTLLGVLTVGLTISIGLNIAVLAILIF